MVSLFLPLYQTPKVKAQETIVYTATTETHYLPDGRVFTILYSVVRYAQAHDGVWVNASDVLKITKQSDDLTFHYDGIEGYFNLTFETGVFFNGVYYSMAEVKDLTGIEFDFPIQRYPANRKYAVNITNILVDKSNINNITLTYKDHYGFTLDQLLSEGGKIFAKQIMELGFGDLEENNFTVTLNMAEKRIYIGNLTDKFVGDSLYLDPTIKLQDQDTQHMDDSFNREQFPTNNYGNAPTHYLMNNTNSGFERQCDAVYKFNISSIPSGQQIDDASFYWFVYDNALDTSDEGYDATAHHCYAFPAYNISDVEWEETVINWDNRPTTSQQMNLTAESQFQYFGGTGEPEGWQNFTVTNMVAKDYDDGNNNVTIYFIPENAFGDPGSSDYLQIRSKEYTNGDIETRPYLNITYSGAAGEAYVSDLTQSVSTAWSVLTEWDAIADISQSITTSWAILTEWDAILDVTQALTTSWNILANLNTFVDLSQAVSSTWNVLMGWDAILDFTQSLTTTWNILIQSTFNVVTSLSNAFSWIIDVVRTVGGIAYVAELSQAISTSWAILTQWNAITDFSQSLTTSWMILTQTSFNIIASLSNTFSWIVDVVRTIAGVNYIADLSQAITTTWTILTQWNSIISLSQALSTTWAILTQSTFNINLAQTLTTTWTVLIQSTFNIITSLSNTFTWTVDIYHWMFTGFAYTVDLSLSILTSWITDLIYTPYISPEVTTFGTVAFVIAIIALAIGVTAFAAKKS